MDIHLANAKMSIFKIPLRICKFDSLPNSNVNVNYAQ